MKKIDSNLEIGKIYGDLKVIKFIKIQSNVKIYKDTDLINELSKENWNLKNGRG